MKNRVLVTGLEGFTGVHLEDALHKSGFEVFGTSLNPSTKSNIFTCNITKRDEIERIVLNVQPTYVIHLAAISFVGETNGTGRYGLSFAFGGNGGRRRRGRTDSLGGGDRLFTE